jgi:hypothetical protein
MKDNKKLATVGFRISPTDKIRFLSKLSKNNSTQSEWFDTMLNAYLESYENYKEKELSAELEKNKKTLKEYNEGVATLQANIAIIEKKMQQFKKPEKINLSKKEIEFIEEVKTIPKHYHDGRFALMVNEFGTKLSKKQFMELVQCEATD